MRSVAKVDESFCLGYGDCAAVAPEVFEVDEIAAVVGDGTAEEILEAAKACPADAISVLDAATGTQLYP